MTALAGLLAEDWDHELREAPVYASLLGDRRWSARWDDLSLEAIEARRRHDRELVARLDALLASGALDGEDRLDAELLRKDHATWAEAAELGWQHLPVSPQGGLPEGVRQHPAVQAAYQLADQLRFDTAQDLEAWRARLEGFGAYVAQVTALLREGVRRGLVQPRVVMERVPPQVERQLAIAPEASPWLAPFRREVPGVPAAERERLAAEAAHAVREGVYPALRSFLTFLAGTYLPAAPAAVGLSERPGGDALYVHWARRSTTTDLAPGALHDLGLGEVARVREEMERVRARAGFATLEGHFRFLREDPRFFHRTPEALLAAYRALARRVDRTLPRLFRTLPRMPYVVEPTPEVMAPDATTGFYFPGAPDGSRPGTYQVNLYRPETRPTWEMLPLTLHEAVPGHHLQTALAAEQAGLPAFRRHGYHMAYGEGWALYAESLAGELGLVESPHDELGLLAWEMWRSVRLVVDTGLHVKGWTRERALAYFLEHAPRPPLDAANEVDRYIATPGQALAYRVGQLRLRALRDRAGRTLGDRFDVRAFHDAVLLAGTLPLDVLERRIDAWIAVQRAHK